MDEDEDNALNLLYFDGPSMRGLYAVMDAWQKTYRKRLQSISIHKDGERFCCIALTNPSEVVIVHGGDGKKAQVRGGRLQVDAAMD